MGGHIADAVSDRLAGSLTDTQEVLGGQSLAPAQMEGGDALIHWLGGLSQIPGAYGAPGSLSGVAPGSWPGEVGAARNGAAALAPRHMSGREVLLGSAINLSQDGAEGGGPILTAWGSVEASGFGDEETSGTDTARVVSESTTGNFGADAVWRRLVAGVSVSLSNTEGAFEQPGAVSGTTESRLTTVSSFAQFVLNERVAVWGLLGYGTGDASTMIRLTGDLVPSGFESRADIAMRFGAVGARGGLRSADEAGGIDLAVNADAFFSETESKEASNPVATTADASRLRLFLEASRMFATRGGAVVTQGLELGLRHEGADAETGTGMELSGRIAFADPASGFSVDASASTMLAHEDSDYEEWGASVSVRRAPGASDRGLSFSLEPSWGVTSGGVERLRSARETRVRPPGSAFEIKSRLDAELGFGLAVGGGAFTGTPYAGLGVSGGGRDWRLGWRLIPVPVGAGLDFSIGIEATRSEPANESARPQHGVAFTGAVRW